MYLHLGNDVVIQTKYLIGVFDLENTSISKDTKTFLAHAEKHGRVKNVSYQMPKSFLVTLDEEFTETVYITNIAVRTLAKRFGNQLI